MLLKDCYELGHITKTHGLKGELVFYLDVDEPEDYGELDGIYVLENQILVPYTLESIRLQAKNKAIVKLKEVSSFAIAEKLLKLPLYLPLELLPKLRGNQFYFHEVIGFQVIQEGKVIGEIRDIYSNPPTDLLVVERDSKEILIPMITSIIVKINRKEKEFWVTLPEGLLEIYLEP